MKKIKWIFIVLLLWSCPAHAEIIKEPIKSGIELKPGQAESVTVASAEDLEIGWEAIQEPKCTEHCVRATDKSGGYEYTIATDLGASMKYTPVDGKIVIEYANIVDHAVTINVYQLQRTCDAEACAFIQGDEITRWLVFKGR